MNLGQTVKDIRTGRRTGADDWRDWTVAACAARADLSVGYWRDVESGRRTPGVDKLPAIAAGLRMQPSRLIAAAECT